MSETLDIINFESDISFHSSLMISSVKSLSMFHGHTDLKMSHKNDTGNILIEESIYIDLGSLSLQFLNRAFSLKNQQWEI